MAQAAIMAHYDSCLVAFFLKFTEDIFLIMNQHSNTKDYGDFMLNSVLEASALSSAPRCYISMHIEYENGKQAKHDTINQVMEVLVSPLYTAYCTTYHF